MAYGTVNADVIQSSVSGVSLGAGNATVFKNRIINGAMTIDQRNAGASVTLGSGNTYTLDRWVFNTSQASKISAQQSSSAPTGFSNSLLVTSLSAYSVGASDFFIIRQKIEGFNTSDLSFGTINAKTVTLSFWVNCSLTGQFSGAIFNSAENRFYPFLYTINSANTWEQKSITIAGDTTGTWVGATNGIGLQVDFGLGAGSNYSNTPNAWTATNGYNATGGTSVVGTNGATFYLTGVQLEVGSSATGFEYRDFGRELQMCQRYFEKSYDQGTAVASSTTTGCSYTTGATDGSGSLVLSIPFSVVKRTNPTVTFYTHTGTAGSWYYARNGIGETTMTMNSLFIGTRVINCYGSTGAGWAAAYMYGQWIASAEL